MTKPDNLKPINVSRYHIVLMFDEGEEARLLRFVKTTFFHAKVHLYPESPFPKRAFLKLNGESDHPSGKWLWAYAASLKTYGSSVLKVDEYIEEVRKAILDGRI